MKKRSVAMMGLLLAVGLFAGCAGGGTKDAEATEGAASQVEEKKEAGEVVQAAEQESGREEAGQG